MRFLSFLVSFFSLFFLIRSEPNSNNLIKDNRGSLINKDSKPIDIVFVLDSSANIFIENWVNSLSFIADTVNLLKNQTNSHFAAISYSCKVDVAWDLNSDKAKNSVDIGKNLLDVNKSNGIKNTHKALLKSIKLFKESKSFHLHKKATKVVILVVDGQSKKLGKTKKAAALLKKKNINLFIVTTENKNEGEYREILDCKSVDCSNLITTNWYDIQKLAETITSKITNVTKNENSDDESSDDESSDDENSDDENSDDENSDDENSDDENSDGESSDGKTLDGKTLDGKTLDGKTLDGKTLDGKTSDGESLDGKNPKKSNKGLCNPWTNWTVCSEECEGATRSRHSFKSDNTTNCETFQTEKCLGLPQCDESTSSGKTTTVLVACAVSVAAVCLIGGAAYYAKGFFSSPPVDNANYEVGNIDKGVDDPIEEEVVRVGPDSEFWLQNN